MRRRKKRSAVPYVAFGLGLIVAYYCPLKLLVVIMAIAVIYLSICCFKC